jgi:hypothetical protein
MTCPTCRASWRERTECPRCGSDLAPLMRIAAAAWRHGRAAVTALAAGNVPDALAHALEARTLQRTEAGDDLVFFGANVFIRRASE